MPVRGLPVRPDLDALTREAEQLHRGLHARDRESVALYEEFHPAPVDSGHTSLADAQLALARSYQASAWSRLVEAAALATAIWNDDLNAVRDLVHRNASLLHEPVLIRRGSNWGPPLSYAANLGRDAIIRMLHGLGATDLEPARQRAALQGHVATARLLHELAGRPRVGHDELGGPAYTLNADGTAFFLALGAPVVDQEGRRLAPVDVVLETDSRKPAQKHAILEMYARHGLELPDTAVMALHRGRLDLLERHIDADPGLLTRTFSHREIYPAEMGCGDPLNATVGTPLAGTTLLHLCVDYDELEIARWLLDRGMSPNVTAAIGAHGFGGYTPLFNAVVSQPNFWMNYRNRGPFTAPFAELLLERGADPNVRASLWKQLHPGHGDSTRYEYRDVTPLSWGRRFHAPVFVSVPALELIESAGGHE